MSKTADAVVIGGGIVGVSVAYHLAEAGMKEVVLLEKELMLGTGSSAASAGVIYHHHPEQVNVELSSKSMQAVLEFEDKFEAKIDFRRYGCIQTAGVSESLEELTLIYEQASDLGVDVRMLKPNDLLGFFPEIVFDDLLGAIFTPNDGYFDPHGMIQGYAEKARRLGVTFLTQAPAMDILTEDNRISAVKTPTENIETEIVVNAAGPRAVEIAELAGARNLPVTPLKRQIFISALTDVMPSDAPFYIDQNPPFYIRPESGGLLMSIMELDPCPNFDLNLDWNSAPILAERATRRFPFLDRIQLARSWAGLRSMTPDHTAILGPVPELEGFHLAVGFSGHGVMHAPLTGKILASMIVDCNIERFDGIDLAQLRYERFSE